MKRFLLLALASLTLLATSALSSTGWTDVTAAPYSADYKCTSGTDDGPAINQAILDASASITLNNAGGWVIYFPPGCYQIATSIVDAVTNGGITYLGFGRVILSAVPKSGVNPATIIKFGDDSHTTYRRRLSNFWFECNGLSNTDGIEIDGLKDSEFDDIEIRDCSGYALRSVGTSTDNYSNVFEGGGPLTSSTSGKGFYLGYGSNNWTFKGTRFTNTSGSSSSVGLDFEGSGNVCLGCTFSGWGIGLAATQTSLGAAADGLEVSGGYFENNKEHIRLGLAGVASAKIHGASIHGAYLHGNGTFSNPGCIDIQQADGFSISGNQFLNCVTYNIYGFSDATNQGADNGIIANNSFNGTATNSLLGSNITLISAGQLMQINSTSNCSQAVNPAVCASDVSGSVGIPAGTTSVVVDTTAVTANSQILVTFDSSLGSKLGVTCNTTFVAPFISARTAGTSFTISVTAAPSTNPACFSYTILN